MRGPSYFFLHYPVAANGGDSDAPWFGGWVLRLTTFSIFFLFSPFNHDPLLGANSGGASHPFFSNRITSLQKFWPVLFLLRAISAYPLSPSRQFWIPRRWLVVDTRSPPQGLSPSADGFVPPLKFEPLRADPFDLWNGLFRTWSSDPVDKPYPLCVPFYIRL